MSSRATIFVAAWLVVLSALFGSVVRSKYTGVKAKQGDVV